MMGIDPKVGAAAAKFTQKMGLMGQFSDSKHAERSVYPNPSLDHMTEALQVWSNEYAPALKAFLQKHPEYDGTAKKRFFLLEEAHTLEHMVCVSHLPEYELQNGSKQTLLEAIDAYDFNGDGQEFKKIAGKQDWFRSGMWLHLLALRWGELAHAKVWQEKTLAGYKNLNLSGNFNYKQTGQTLMAEIGDNLNTPLHVLLLLGHSGLAWDLLQAMGLGWDERGFDAWWACMKGHGVESMGTLPKDTYYAMAKLLLVCTAPQGALDKGAVESWMKYPTELAERNKAWFTHAGLGLAGVLHLGARAFERLGNDGAAAECARLGTTAQKKKALSADCRCVLGRVAARQGSADEADKEFKLAVEEAMDARCYALAVVAAREWKAAVLDNAGRSEEADTRIEAACSAMGKSPSEMAAQLGPVVGAAGF
jgi:hypothetical protein